MFSLIFLSWEKPRSPREEGELSDGSNGVIERNERISHFFTKLLTWYYLFI